MSDERDKQLARIRALIRQAERTNFPEEAETFFARAQELITKFAIEEAELDGARQTEENPITTSKIEVWTPYPAERLQILVAVAGANDCRTITTNKIGAWSVTVVGFRRDLERVELLYTSLAAHAAKTMKTADKRGENPQRFYRSFLIGFGDRLGERLREARAAVLEESGGLLPVLADRSQLVNDAVGNLFPNLKYGKAVVARSATGLYAGERAANSADLGQSRVGSQGAIR